MGDTCQVEDNIHTLKQLAIDLPGTKIHCLSACPIREACSAPAKRCERQLAISQLPTQFAPYKAGRSGYQTFQCVTPKKRGLRPFMIRMLRPYSSVKTSLFLSIVDFPTPFTSASSSIEANGP